MTPEDLIRVRHMLDAINEALVFSQGKSRDDLDNNRMLTLAIIKELEIIGEAASKITPEFKANQPLVPWLDIVGMRNRLTHGYFDIDLDLVWTTVQEDLPFLLDQLKVMVVDNG
jgi:uncharacterized protein with HEPN domain